jgi:D-glycero-D-manno-heptose 1,7-bisphosphate phosphatase
MRRALFLDRDGTLVEPRHYPSRSEHLRLYPGLTPSLRALQAHGFRLVVVTNQSGLARGLFSADDLAAMHASLAATLAADGVRIDAFYYCPHHPEGIVPALAVDCDCRKPRPGMLERAASDLDLDLHRSWLIGDILDDVEAGNRIGCRTVLVDLGTEARPASSVRWPVYVARDTRHALATVCAAEGIGPALDEDYLPPSWQQPSGPPGAAPGEDSPSAQPYPPERGGGGGGGRPQRAAISVECSAPRLSAVRGGSHA